MSHFYMKLSVSTKFYHCLFLTLSAASMSVSTSFLNLNNINESTLKIWLVPEKIIIVYKWNSCRVRIMLVE